METPGFVVKAYNRIPYYYTNTRHYSKDTEIQKAAGRRSRVVVISHGTLTCGPYFLPEQTTSVLFLNILPLSQLLGCTI